MDSEELYNQALTAMKYYSEASNEEIIAAKKAVNDFYNGLTNINKFNKAIEIFNELYPNGTFEDLKKWAANKTVILKVKRED